MRTLVIETATAMCSVALLDEEAVADSGHAEVGRGHAERLLPMIAALAGGGRADRILVDCGPGSFTGIRVGLAAARALGFAWDAPVSGYHSLALLAAASRLQGDATVAIEGGHGQLFLGGYHISPLAQRAPPRSLPFEDAVRAIADTVVIGDAAVRVVAARGYGRAVAATVDARVALLLPAALTALAPTPFYGRQADAVPIRPATR